MSRLALGPGLPLWCSGILASVEPSHGSRRGSRSRSARKTGRPHRRQAMTSPWRWARSESHEPEQSRGSIGGRGGQARLRFFVVPGESHTPPRHVNHSSRKGVERIRLRPARPIGSPAHLHRRKPLAGEHPRGGWMANTVAVTVARWMAPHRHGGHVLRDLVLLVGIVAAVATFVQTIR